MKLEDLEPQFLKSTGQTSSEYVDTLQEADGIMFVCPLCLRKRGERPGVHSIICWFVGKVPDSKNPGPGRWTPAGTSFKDLSFVPSEGRTESVLLTGGCCWHGFIRNGEVTDA